jgi:CRP-like cAMP-binding protein
MRTLGGLENAGHKRSIVAGTTIFAVGAAPDCMYSIIEGQVDLLVNGKLVETVSPGGIFGEMALIDNDNRTATAVAKTDLKVVSIDQSEFLRLVQQTPSFALHVMRALTDRLRRMDERVLRVSRP